MKFTTERIVPNQPECQTLLLTHLARYRFARPFVRDAVTLDAGCGCGYGSHYLATEGAKRVVGVDISPEAVAYARQHYSAANLDFQVADVSTLTFPNEAFDAVVCLEVLEHVQDQQRLLAEVNRVLKPGGQFIVSTPNAHLFSPGGRPLNPWHIHEFSQDEFVAALAAHFQDIRLWGQTVKASIALPFSLLHLRILRYVTTHRALLSRVVGFGYDSLRRAFMLLTRLVTRVTNRDPVVIVEADELAPNQIWYFLAVGSKA